ncbi:MAG: hypothetical protein M3220_21275 [Chloroflexota bacterium]|nr:hypothetical protein [Chloroflexota bacterium]
MATGVITQRSGPSAGRAGYGVTVRRARAFLRFLLLAMALTGVITTVISFLAVQTTVQRYQAIVTDSARSADAAQEAREAVLASHSAVATFLSRLDNPDEAAEEARRGDIQWREYQEALREIWQNRSDAQFGEFAVFEAADSATLRYRGRVDAMHAFVEVGEQEAAQDAFLEGHQILVRELLPALNGLESVKLERMEEAYAITSAEINRWQQTLFYLGATAVGLLVLAFLATRYWLRYAWTWELVVASVVGLLLFGWFNITLIRAADDVEVLVRQAYDTISGIQSVEALLTQADALESMAVFDPARSERFLSDADEYLFLLEQQLCGDRACTDTAFIEGSELRADKVAAAFEGQQTYGLPRAPLLASASTNQFEGEAVALEELRVAVQEFRAANVELREGVAAGSVPRDVLEASEVAYARALDASEQVRQIARDTFEGIYRAVVWTMAANRWLSLLFTGLALLGFWGLRRRREALYP